MVKSLYKLATAGSILLLVAFFTAAFVNDAAAGDLSLTELLLCAVACFCLIGSFFCWSTIFFEALG
jgi:hypothetical protein